MKRLSATLISCFVLLCATISVPALAEVKDYAQQVDTSALQDTLASVTDGIQSVLDGAKTNTSELMDSSEALSVSEVQNAQTPAGASSQEIDDARTDSPALSNVVPSSIPGVVWDTGYTTCTIQASTTVDGLSLQSEIASHRETLTTFIAEDYTSLNGISMWLFYNCSSLSAVNLASSFDTSAVTDMSGMFYGCSALSSLTFPTAFDTSKVTNMSSMFADCSAFETLNISSFNTQNTENFSAMFAGATRLTTLDSSKLVSPKAQTMASMFEGDAALRALNLSALTAPTTLTTTASMFSGCSALSTLNLAGLALGSTVTTTDMFKSCTALTEITLAKNFVFGTATGFAFAGTAPTNFWIADINTKMGTTAATWNTYLAALTANATSHTFTIATRTYTLDANGGLFGTSDAATETLSYYGNEGGALGTIATPTRTGWIQNNWWTTATGGSQVTIPSTFPAAASTTVYAHWNRDSNYAEVSFNTNGGSFVESQMVAIGTPATRPQDPTLANATFDTWCADTALEVAFDFMTTPITQDTTLYARWKAQDPTNYSVVNFNTQGGSFVDSQVVANGSRATRPATIPTKEHYVFDNWYADADATNLWDFTADTITQDTTIYAGWKIPSYTITFNANGQTFKDGSTEKSEAFDLGADLIAPELSLPEDVEFVGWFTEPTGGAPMPQKCSGTATYFAQYNILPPEPTPEPTPDAGGELMPITGDTLSASSWMFLAVFVGGIALTAAHILRRKRSL